MLLTDLSSKNLFNTKIMKRRKGLLNNTLIFLLMLAFLGCEPEEQGPEDFYDHDNFTVSLSADRSMGKGQYSRRAESGDEVNVDVNIQSATPLTELAITKTINLTVDSTFGNNGTLLVNASGNALDYDFHYVADTTDVDQLVGFTFEATNAAGETEVSDLTLAVTLSPRDNLPRKRWALTSILHVNNNNEEVIKECEKDNAMLLNADSTVVMDYGADTGAGDCVFDGFKVYDQWYLTEDEKQFVLVYHGLFDPTTTVESYEVKTLTTEELGIELTIDLTVLGLGIETFLYTYQATPR